MRSGPALVGPPTDYLFAADFRSGLSGLQLFQGDGTVTTTISGGVLNTTVNAGGVDDAFWYNEELGCLYTVPIAGDFDAVLTGYVRNLADSGLPTVGDGNFRIAGLAAHDPDRSTNLDYEHVGWGCTASASVTCEWKDTVASTSDFGAVAATTGAGQLRLRRVGQVFSMFHRASTLAAWTAVHSFDRVASPMPTVLDVGIMPPYASVASHDLRLFVSGLVITRP